MDNAPHAWKLSVATMRTPTLALLVSSLGLFVPEAVETRAAPDHAREALSSRPPERDIARAMLDRTASEVGSEATAEALYRLGELDEAEGNFERAAADDRACAAAAPNTRWAVRATERLDWLRSRSEGGYVPLARLERVRRSPALASDPAAIDALAHEAQGFPPGIVRVEARMLVAEAWLGRLGRPRDAIAVLREVAGDPGADALTAGLAERQLIGALAAGGALDEAAAEARSHASLLEPRFVRQVERLLLRRRAKRAAIGVIAVCAGLAAIALLRARRRHALGDAARALRGLAPVAVPFAAFLGIAGGVLASRYESGNALPFLLLGAATLPLVLVARAWSAVGSPWPAARVGRALLCSATIFAAAFVLLDAVSPEYLEGFGL